MPGPMPLFNPQPNMGGYVNNYLNQYTGQFNTLIGVSGLDAAKNFLLPPNSKIALFDANEDYMYIKVTDGSGYYNIRRFRYTEEPIEESVTGAVQGDANFVTREEFNALVEVIKNGQHSD